MINFKKPLNILMLACALIAVLVGVLGARAYHRHALLASIPLRISDSAADMIEAEAVAQSSLSGRMDGLHGDYASFGFKNESELDHVTLGNPYEGYELMPAAVQNYSAGEHMLDIAVQRRVWEFPVLVNGEGRGTLTVAFFEGRWQVVEFGGYDFGKRLADMEKHLDLPPGSVSIIRIVPPMSSFAVFDRDGEERIIVLGAWPDVVGDVDQAHFTEYPTNEIMARLQAYYWWSW